MPVVGKVNTNVKCGQQSKNLEFIVMMGKGLSLFGRNWREQLHLDWAKIGIITSGKVPLNCRLSSANMHLFSRTSLARFLLLKPHYVFAPM